MKAKKEKREVMLFKNRQTHKIPLDDEKIIGLYWTRDQRAIEETARSYGGYCYKIAYNILAEERDSEECVSDTYMKAWASIPPEQPDSLRLFLSKIVRNISLDLYRRKNRQKRGSGVLEEAIEEVEQFSLCIGGVEDEIAARELARTINRFLSSLPERDCNIFLRRYYFVDSTANIAKRYRIKEGTALKILSRTRIKLKLFLESEGYTV
jgi:RNA polymerase sigma-70 factor (ECF subfamily)